MAFVTRRMYVPMPTMALLGHASLPAPVLSRRRPRPRI